MKNTILILTKKGDRHITPIAEELARRNVPMVTFDVADFPEHIQIAARIDTESDGWQGPLCLQDHTYDLADIRSIWYRRPTPYVAPTHYIPPVRAFLALENLRGFVGILHGPFWVSPRGAIQAAEFKPAQLQAAQAQGLSLPRTLITNDPTAVRAFFDECHGAVISKAVARGVVDPEGHFMKDHPRFMHTSRVAREDLKDAEGVRVCAHLFQELILKAMDVRVTVIGRQVFTVGIHSHTEESALDWRRGYGSLTYTVEKLPNEIEQKLLQVVRGFGLQYSSADFILTPQGDYIFVELNPNGQFYFLVPPTHVPMAEAMVDLLCSPEEYRIC
ncbi:MAG: hypothetical protein H0U76_23850 [Ktedonobacteraceae bacterium]|nr:hypothetical protein [Ktedonobacteraceae bacterium]